MDSDGIISALESEFEVSGSDFIPSDKLYSDDSTEEIEIENGNDDPEDNGDEQCLNNNQSLKCSKYKLSYTLFI